MTTPAEWRRKAAEYARKAKEATEAGDAEEALVMDRAYDTALRVAELMEQQAQQPEQRRKGSRSVTLKSMLPAARARISKGNVRSESASDLQRIANAANHTLRSLAEAVGCSNVFLTKAIRGDKAIRESWAKQIQELTRSKEYPAGFAATKRNWPGGWAREPSE